MSWMTRSVPLLCVAASLWFSGLLPHFSQAQGFEWVVGVGSSVSDQGNAVAADGNGNVYVTGSFTGSVDFGGTVLSSTNLAVSDVFIASYDDAGNLRWAKKAGSGLNPCTGYSIAFFDDGVNGKVYAVGVYRATNSGSAVFGGGEPNETLLFGVDGVSSDTDLFVAQFDASSGALNWVNAVTGTDNLAAYGVSVDPTLGTAFVTGSYESDANIFDQTFAQVQTMTNLTSTEDVLTTYYDVDGFWIGAFSVEGSGIDQARDISYYQDPNSLEEFVYLTGYFDSPDLDWGLTAGTTSTAGMEDIFLAKVALSPLDGVWAVSAGGSGDDRGLGLAISSQEEIYLTGFANDEINFGGIALPSSGTRDAVIAKYDNAGFEVWANRTAGGGAIEGHGIVLDYGDEYPIIVGQGTGGSFGTDPAGSTVTPTTMLTDIFMARYDGNSGSIVWVEIAGGVTVDNGLGIATNPFRDIYLTGTYQSTAQFGSESTPASNGALDIFVAKFQSPVFENSFVSFTEVDQGEAAWADIDIDGDLDVVITGRDINALPLTKVYLNNDDGTFTDLGQAGLPNLYNSSIDFYDVNGDGDLDALILGNNGSNEVTALYENTTGSSFGNPITLLSTELGDVHFVDVNNDGYHDLFITGMSGGLPTTRIYINNQQVGNYTETSPISQYGHADADWGDYDNDGDMDLLISGLIQLPSDGQTVIWQNDGSGNFTLVDLPISNLSPAVDWGDYDADGDLDIFVAGYFSGGGGVESIILRNDNGNFLNIGGSLQGLAQGDAQWGDYDNDGDLDVLATGTPDGTTTTALIFQNQGNNTFTEIDPGFVGVMNGSLSLTNYDNDGDLDAMIVGLDDEGDLNAILYSGIDDEFNLPPDPPGGLTSNVSNGQVTLGWDAGMASDDFTAQSGLTWNIYVGTGSGGSDIVAPLSDIGTGVRQVMENGNMDHSAGTTLSLPDGLYFWSVQGVDGAYERGAFATEQSFTISSTTPDIAINPPFLDVNVGEGQTANRNFNISNVGEADLQWNLNSHIQDGNSAQFDGIDDFILMPAGGALTTGEVSIEAWIKPTGKTGEQNIIDHRAADGGWQLRIAGDTYPMGLIMVLKNSAGVEDVHNVNGVIQNNQWQHVAATLNGTNVSIFVNGILVSTTPLGNGFTFNPAAISNWSISDNSSFSFQGNLDEIRVWNVGRAQSQIEDNAFQVLGGEENNLVGYWNFDNDAGTTAVDGSANINDGTFTNGTTLALSSDRPFTPGWLSGSAFSGTVTPSGSQDITVTLTAGALAQGTYRTQIGLNSNDPDQPFILLPVTMAVVPAAVVADPTDSLALVALYNATNGNSWTDKSGWLTEPVSNWNGITLNSSGKVIEIVLTSNNLTGSLPTSVNISDLQVLDLSNNQIGGTIPAAISNFTQLTRLQLGENNLSGGIPNAIWNLTLLTVLELNDNSFTGSIPDQVSNLSQLTSLQLQTNQLGPTASAFLTAISGITQINLSNNEFEFVPDFSGHANLIALAVENNRLTFEDLIPNQAIAFSDYTFSPQKNFGTISTLNKNEGESGQINLNVDAGVSNNSYDWYRNDVFLTNSGSINTFSFSNLKVEDGGAYVAKVTNPAIPGFEITSQPQYVTVSCLSTPAGGSSSTLVTINLTGTTPGGSHPAHIHMNSAAVGGSIVLTFNPVDGNTGESVTEVTQFDNSTPVTYQELLNYDGYVIVHVAGAGVGAAVATGDIGSNAPDSMGVYSLVEVNGSGVSGTITFESAGDEAEDSKIDQVVLGTIDNNTAGTTCETYSDFTDQSTDLSIGQSATVSVTLGSCDAYYPKFGKVYIDWDLSGTFSESEVVASTAVPIDTTGTFEGTFSVPGTATLGTTVKMRVVCWESEYVSEGVTSFDIGAVTGCSDAQFLWGETEDYSINIVVPSLPDLVPQILSIDSTTVAAGAAVNPVARVLNESAIGAAASTLAYFLSTDNILDEGDVFLGESPSGAIPGFEFSDFNGSVLIPAATPAGNYNLIFEADALDDVVESNEDNNEAFVAISVVATGDTIVPMVRYEDRPAGYIPGSGGFEITVRATDDESGINVVGVFFKQITMPGTDLLEDFEFRLAEQSSGDSDVYGVRFTDDDFGVLGIEYFFVAEDNSSNVNAANILSATTTVAFESRTLAGLTAGNMLADYELISFPLVFESPNTNTIFDELGTYDAEVWRLFYWNPTSQSYTERPSTVSAGLGYWLIFANQTSIQVENARAVDATLTRPFKVTLRNGWNQIGSPYLSTLSWSDVLDHNITQGIITSGDVGNPFIYNRNFSETSSLEPFEGAFVEANATIELEIPLQAVSGISGRKGGPLAPARESPLDASDWELRFSLSAGEYSYNLGGIGMHPAAEIGKDPFDRSTLPRLYQYLDLNFAHPEHIIPFFSRDIVPTADNYTWDFTVENTLPEKKTTLQWNNTFFGINAKQLVLFDQDLQKTIDMREVNSYDFGVSGVRHFKAPYGDLDYIESEIQPNRLVLGDAYPNPFNQQTTIPYSLPESDLDYRVNLSIYNSLGQRVATLVDRSQSTGFYQAIWNGKSERGNQMGPGIYIYQLRISGLADNPVLTGKLVVR